MTRLENIEVRVEPRGRPRAEWRCQEASMEFGEEMPSERFTLKERSGRIARQFLHAFKYA
jgi:hypothetical protein